MTRESLYVPARAALLSAARPAALPDVLRVAEEQADRRGWSSGPDPALTAVYDHYGDIHGLGVPLPADTRADLRRNLPLMVANAGWHPGARARLAALATRAFAGWLLVYQDWRVTGQTRVRVRHAVLVLAHEPPLSVTRAYGQAPTAPGPVAADVAETVAVLRRFAALGVMLARDRALRPAAGPPLPHGRPAVV